MVDDFDGEAGLGKPIDDGSGALRIGGGVLHHADTVSGGCDTNAIEAR